MDDSGKRPIDEKKVKFKPNILSTRKEALTWIITITIASFILASSISFASSKILKNINIIMALGILFIIILINILSDIVGTAVTAADETPFHAMASRKFHGARQSIRLIRNADKVSNFCNDVIGDISGIISGVASAYIIIRIIGDISANPKGIAFELIMTGMVAAITVGGKAIGKNIAIKNSNYIVYKVSAILLFLFGRINFEKSKKRNR